ncbi:MAG TPA: LamG-like jellyroll fold domain-containing protein, partial [Steroidobacteraceae bacterium]|nr:LamG-like jellyroll fold domain-containing protein [Steroidobacteraceae bacterium]
KMWVNGVFTGDVDPSKGGSFANWDSSFALVLGNETSGQRQWQGVIKMVAIYNTALNQTQIQQNFAAGVGQKYFLLFGVSSLTGVNQSYLVFTASQYDNYSYLFAQPKFISLDPSAAIPANLTLAGMRIGVNGQLAPAGQAFTTVNTTIGGSNYTPANGQLLSSLGTVVPVSLGPANDLFFLSFDQLGSNSHTFVDPAGTPTPPTPNNTPVPDYGIATYERINNTLSRITGVPITDPPVQTLYMSAQQAMPATPLIAAFISSQQTAISALANAYCGELMANASYRDAFFGNGLDASLSASSSSFFGASGSSNRAIVINALSNNAVGTNVAPQMAAAVQSEVDALITRVPQINAAATVTQTTVAACTATLASAAVTLQ